VSVISDVTTYRISPLMDRTNGSDTYYYWFAGRRIAVRSSAGLSYLYADNLGSTMVTSGAAVSDELYTPWGTARDMSQQAAVPYRYTGQREEAALGLYDYGARWYDPSIGRFIQADTIVPQPGNPQSLNRYSYGLNNPMKYTDPTGHVVRDESDGSGVPNYLYRLMRETGLGIGNWREPTSDGWQDLARWTNAEVTLLKETAYLMAARMGGRMQSFRDCGGDISVFKVEGDSSAGDQKIYLTSSFASKPSPKALFAHEWLHIESERSGTESNRNSDALMLLTQGRIRNNKYYQPGGLGAVTSSPFTPGEDYSDGGAGYFFPSWANSQYANHMTLIKSLGVAGIGPYMRDTYVGSSRWQYFSSKWQ
jgi:RHS repeat-associated protein